MLMLAGGHQLTAVPVAVKVHRSLVGELVPDVPGRDVERPDLAITLIHSQLRREQKAIPNSILRDREQKARRFGSRCQFGYQKQNCRVPVTFNPFNQEPKLTSVTRIDGTMSATLVCS